MTQSVHFSFASHIAMASFLCLAITPTMHLRVSTPNTVQTALEESPQRLLFAQLRKACVAKLELHGVRVAALSIDEDKISIQGLIERQDQAELLRTETANLVKSQPALGNLRGAAVDTSLLRLFPIKAEFLPKMQIAFAENLLINARTHDLLRRTRLDDATYDEDGGLVFDGVCIDTQAEQEASSGNIPPDSASNRILVEIEELLEEMVTSETFVKLDLYNNKLKLRFLKSPVDDLQATLNQEEALDGVLLSDAVYDRQGRLSFLGLVQDDRQRTSLESLLARTIANPLVRRSAKEPQITVSQLGLFPLNSLRTRLQQRIAAHASPVLRQSRVQRLYLVAPGEMQIELMSFHPDLAEPSEELQHEIQSDLSRFVDSIKAEEAIFTPIAQMRTLRVTYVEHPLGLLQTQIEKEPVLDGVRIEDCYFDMGGDLMLEGAWEGETQAKPLAALIKSKLAAAKHPLAATEVQFGLLRPLPTRSLLRSMRALASSSLDEFRLERLHFTSDGKLRVVGVCPRSNDLERTKTEFSRLIAEHDVAGYLKAAMQRHAKDSSALDSQIVLDIRDDAPSLVRFLRNLVSQQRELDGLCIERGSYDDEGVFLVLGVQDHTGQAERLEKLLATVAAKPEWKSALPNGQKMSPFKTAPLSEMIDCLQIALPAYRNCDGLQLQSAFYDTQNRLAFRGKAIGSVPPQAAAQIVAMLSNRPEWKARVVGGVSLEQLQIEQRNEQLSQNAIVNGLQQVTAAKYDAAIHNLDTAVLHAPEDSIGWYLRAVCHLQSKRPQLARRDFFRVAVLENRQPATANERHKRLGIVNFQGDRRIQADKMVEEIALKLGDIKELESKYGIEACARTEKDSGK